MDIFISLVIFAMLIFVAIYPKGILAINIYETTTGDKATLGMKILCCVPLWNSIVIKRVLYGMAKIQVVIYYLFIVAFLARVASLTIFVNNGNVMLVTGVIMMVALLAWYISEVMISIEMATLYGARTLVKVVSVIPPLAQYFIAGKVISFTNKNKDEIDGTFTQ